MNHELWDKYITDADKEEFLFEVTINGHTTFIVYAENAIDALNKISPKYYTSSISIKIINPSSPVLICQ